MRATRLLPAAALALWSVAAAGQQAGGLAVSGPGLGPTPPTPEIAGAPLHAAPADVKTANPARAHAARNRQTIARIQGDGGFLDGFFHGQPVAASRQPPPPLPEFNTFIDAPFIVNSFGGPVALDAPGGGAPTINAKDSPVTVNTGPGKVEQRVTSAVNVAVGNNNVAKQTVNGGKP